MQLMYFIRGDLDMKDFSFWQEYEGASEGSGRSEKVWLINPDTNQIGLFKYKKDETTTDHISECIAFQIAKLIGIPCAEFELGFYLGREGSISYNIERKKNEVLIEGIYFIHYTIIVHHYVHIFQMIKLRNIWEMINLGGKH